MHYTNHPTFICLGLILEAFGYTSVDCIVLKPLLLTKMAFITILKLPYLISRNIRLQSQRGLLIITSAAVALSGSCPVPSTMTSLAPGMHISRSVLPNFLTTTRPIESIVSRYIWISCFENWTIDCKTDMDWWNWIQLALMNKPDNTR